MMTTANATEHEDLNVHYIGGRVWSGQRSGAILFLIQTQPDEADNER